MSKVLLPWQVGFIANIKLHFSVMNCLGSFFAPAIFALALIKMKTLLNTVQTPLNFEQLNFALCCTLQSPNIDDIGETDKPSFFAPAIISGWTEGRALVD